MNYAIWLKKMRAKAQAVAAEWAFGFSRPQQNDGAPSSVAQVQVFGL
jgi:hypothetical protein